MEHPQRNQLDDLPVEVSEVSGSWILLTSIVRETFLAGLGHERINPTSKWILRCLFLQREHTASRGRFSFFFASQQPYPLRQYWSLKMQSINKASENQEIGRKPGSWHMLSPKLREIEKCLPAEKETKMWLLVYIMCFKKILRWTSKIKV